MMKTSDTIYKLSKLPTYIETTIKTVNGDDKGHITAINMVIDPIDCDEPCNAIITVTWKNIGEKSEKFKPVIIVNGTKTGEKPEMPLARNQTTTQTFNLNNLTEGTYIICPYPNDVAD